MKIVGLYEAKVKRIGPKHELTGIYKFPVESSLVNTLGLENDVQIDKRYHGGPERALHQYAHSSYEKIIKAYPLLRQTAWPGAMGENISAEHMNEQSVCIGDIYQVGDVRIQVSGPRMPCFKISEKFKTPQLHQFVAKHGIHGWYYRVLQEGKIAVGDELTLEDRPNPKVSIQGFLQVVAGKAQQQGFIQHVAQSEGLDPEWQARLVRQYSLS